MLLDIGMIGPKGVGKTSLLAAMYHEINPLLGQSDLKLVTSDRTGMTQRYLDAAQSDLENIARGLYDVPPGVPNTDDVRTLQFALRDSVRDRRYATMRWTDYPGEWLFPTGLSRLDRDSPDHDELWTRLLRSSAALVAVDTPALMWQEGRLNAQINKPQQVGGLLQEWAGGRGRKSVVVLCALKCEKWVQTPAGRREVEQAARRAYREVIDQLPPPPRGPHVLYMPVQTVGSLHHQTFRLDGDAPVSVFRGAPGAHYQPRWVENPLKAVLINVTDSVYRREAFFAWVTRRNRRLKRQRDAWLARGFDDSVRMWR